MPNMAISDDSFLVDGTWVNRVWCDYTFNEIITREIVDINGVIRDIDLTGKVTDGITEIDINIQEILIDE
jgi:hypothetical protein